LKQLQQNGILYLQFESLPQNGRLHQAVFSRQGGVSPEPFTSLNMSVSVPDTKERVYENRRRAYGMYGRDTASLAHAHLVHGAQVVEVTAVDYGTWPQGDGLITNEPGCGLTMNFADCAPIFVYDPVHQAIGLGHAGWQGAVKDLPGALVRAMQIAYGSDPATLLTTVGPCIGPCCYEVGEPLVGAVQSAFVDSDSLFSANPHPERSNPHFDLGEANRRNLARAGVRQIELSGLCTACRTDLFFSHRAEKGRTGRFGTIFILNR